MGKRIRDKHSEGNKLPACRRKGLRLFLACLALCVSFLFGSPTSESLEEKEIVRLVLEKSTDYYADSWTGEAERGGEIRFHLYPSMGVEIVGSDPEGASLTPQEDGSVWLTFSDVRYTKTVRILTRRKTRDLTYHANGGSVWEDGASVTDESSEVSEISPQVAVSYPMYHLYQNTETGQELFTRDGYTLIGWNTRPDGTGAAVGLGSRYDFSDGSDLYAQWVPWTEESTFLTEESGEGVVIVGYSGEEALLVIPPVIGGKSVYGIAESAFAGCEAETVVLSPGLRQVGNRAFEGSLVREVILFDDLRSIAARAFEGCTNLQTLKLQAASAPVYAGSYFSTFADKMDRLAALRGKPVIGLFSGSSTRFGYQSRLIEEAFPDYAVVNLGVFAYADTYTQYLMILSLMEEGDILISTPEFDAAESQFAVAASMDAEIFAMCEENYDLLTLLDLREVNGVFQALDEYLARRAGMKAATYEACASDFDEDGKASISPSYNWQGDYCLYRPNAESDAPVFGLPVEYTKTAFPETMFLVYNGLAERFAENGITFLFSYAPRNSLAISEASTPEARAGLDAWLRESLAAPVISELEASLMPGRYFWGTDNHLSTEGSYLRTCVMIEDLKAYWERSEEGS